MSHRGHDPSNSQLKIITRLKLHLLCFFDKMKYHTCDHAIVDFELLKQAQRLNIDEDHRTDKRKTF